MTSTSRMSARDNDQTEVLREAMTVVLYSSIILIDGHGLRWRQDDREGCASWSGPDCRCRFRGCDVHDPDPLDRRFRRSTGDDGRTRSHHRSGGLLPISGGTSEEDAIPHPCRGRNGAGSSGCGRQELPHGPLIGSARTRPRQSKNDVYRSKIGFSLPAFLNTSSRRPISTACSRGWRRVAEVASS